MQWLSLVFGLLVMAVRGFYNGKSGSELLGKKLGILAFGNVGRNVARIAKGFGMDVYAYDAFCPAEVIEKGWCTRCCQSGCSLRDLRRRFTAYPSNT